MPVGPNQQWAMDLMDDTPAGGQSIRLLTAIDHCTRECLVLRVAKGFTGPDVASVLNQAGQERSKLPERIRVDNGTEFNSRALDHWAYWNGVALDFSRPEKPVDNCFIESFNGTVRLRRSTAEWTRERLRINRLGN